jgi:Outer membrane protein beta-barrel domain
MTRTLAIIGLAAALGATSTTARAQGFGIKGGLSYGDVSNRGLLPGDLDTRTGFAVGLAAGSSWNLIGIGIEALYAQRGVKKSASADSREIDYLDVPAYLRVALPTPGISPFAYAGPQLSFELRCHAGGTDCPDTDRRHIDYAAVIGAGVRLGGRSAFSLEGRYLYGLSDLKLTTVTTSESYRHRSFLILGGVSF